MTGSSLNSPAGWILLSIVVWVVFFYWPSFVWLGGEWASTRGLFSHGYLVAGVCIFLLVHSYRKVKAEAVGPCWIALPVVLMLSFVWLLGNAADIAAVQTMVLPIIFLSVVLTALGSRAMWSVAFAVLYLYFAIPAWEHLRFIFQAVTTQVVDLLVRLVDIPVYVEGNFVHVPAGTFGISGGCSGLGFILAGLSLATLYGHLFYSSYRARWLLVGVAFLLAVVVNWIRVFSIVLIGNATAMTHPLIANHSTFGWILFTVALIPLLYIAFRLQPESDNLPQVERQPKSDRSANKTVWVSTVAALLSVAIAPVWAYSLRAQYIEQPSVQLSLPAAFGHWSESGQNQSEWRPIYLGTSDEVLGEYWSRQDAVWLYANVYRTQSQDLELIYFRNSAVGNLRPDVQRIREFDSFGATPKKVVEIEAEGVDGRWLVWYWYEIDGRPTTSDSGAKWLQALSVIKGRPLSGVIALATKCDNDCLAARNRLRGFAADAGTEMRLHNWISQGPGK